MSKPAATAALAIAELLEALPTHSWPCQLELPPHDGIYFFYEVGEQWRDSKALRVVRVGSHRGDGNFRTRVRTHFRSTRRRSTFRYHLGAAIIRRLEESPGLINTWEDRRGKPLPEIDAMVNTTIWERFTFRFIALDGLPSHDRLALEARLIDTLSRAGATPSTDWLGNFSPRDAIRKSGLWNVDHVFTENPVTPDDLSLIATVSRRHA